MNILLRVVCLHFVCEGTMYEISKACFIYRSIFVVKHCVKDVFKDTAQRTILESFLNLDFLALI